MKCNVVVVVLGLARNSSRTDCRVKGAIRKRDLCLTVLRAHCPIFVAGEN